jgi:hypothetical protein
VNTTNTDNLDNENVPSYVKVITYFIKQVGFPAMAFLLMFYMSMTSIEKATVAIERSTQALIEFQASSIIFQKQVATDHAKMEAKLDSVIIRKSGS